MERQNLEKSPPSGTIPISDNFRGKLEDLKQCKKLPPKVFITLVSNLNLLGQSIPAGIFDNVNYSMLNGEEENVVLAKIIGELKDGKADIYKPETIKLNTESDIGSLVLHINRIRECRPQGLAKSSDVKIDAPRKPGDFHFGGLECDYEQFYKIEDYDILYNRYPFAPFHFLMVPDRKPKDEKNIHNQYLDPETDQGVLEAILRIVQNPDYKGIRIGYNSLGAHASRNGFHFHGFIVNDNWAPSIENKIKDLKKSGRMNNYYGLAEWITKEDGIDALKDFLKNIYMINKIGNENSSVTYNLYFTPEGIACFPRKHQGDKTYRKLLDDSNFTTGYAFFEMCGDIVCPINNPNLCGNNGVKKRAKEIYDAVSVENYFMQINTAAKWLSPLFIH